MTSAKSSGPVDAANDGDNVDGEHPCGNCGFAEGVEDGGQIEEDKLSGHQATSAMTRSFS